MAQSYLVWWWLGFCVLATKYMKDVSLSGSRTRGHWLFWVLPRYYVSVEDQHAWEFLYSQYCTTMYVSVQAVPRTIKTGDTNTKAQLP